MALPLAMVVTRLVPLDHWPRYPRPASKLSMDSGGSSRSETAQARSRPAGTCSTATYLFPKMLSPWGLPLSMSMSLSRRQRLAQSDRLETLCQVEQLVRKRPGPQGES